jgi:pilus assembly protein Flp/PilA
MLFFLEISYNVIYGENIMLIFSRNEKGQGLVEYALIIVLIALAVILALRLFGVRITDYFQTVVSTMETL